MALKYNPLLKIGLENTGNGSGDIDEKIAALQNAVNALQESLNALKNSKITKVTASSQLAELTDGEIFEWQAASTADFTQGYFYKKNGNNYPRVDLQPNYNLPIAAANLLGGVKVGTGLNIDEGGVLSVTGGDGLKVPRCFTDAQIAALTDGDIFEWQGETTADYVQGYFYKKTSNTTTEVIAGSKYLFVSPAVDFGQYSINQGYYTFIENTAFENVTGEFRVQGTNDFSNYVYFTYQPVAVGNKACKTIQDTGEFVGFVDITSVNSSGVPSAMSDGALTSNLSHSTTPYTSVIAKFQNINTLETVYCVCVPFGSGINVPMLVDIIDNTIYPIKRVNYLERTAAEDITETTIITNRVDTQPQPTNGSGMIVNFTPDTSAMHNNIQSGDTIATMFAIINKYISMLGICNLSEYGSETRDVNSAIIQYTNSNYPFGIVLFSQGSTGLPNSINPFFVIYFSSRYQGNSVALFAIEYSSNQTFRGTMWRNNTAQPTWVQIALNV